MPSSSKRDNSKNKSIKIINLFSIPGLNTYKKHSTVVRTFQLVKFIREDCKIDGISEVLSHMCYALAFIKESRRQMASVHFKKEFTFRDTNLNQGSQKN